jgi:hypothetical protein
MSEDSYYGDRSSHFFVTLYTVLLLLVLLVVECVVTLNNKLLDFRGHPEAIICGALVRSFSNSSRGRYRAFSSTSTTDYSRPPKIVILFKKYRQHNYCNCMYS